MKTFKIAFFALLFMMTGVVSAASLSVAANNPFSGSISNTGSFSQINSATFGGQFSDGFTVTNTGASDAKISLLGGDATFSGNISAFSVFFAGSGDLAVMGSPSWGVNAFSAILTAGSSVQLLVTGAFDPTAAYDLSLQAMETPIPAAVWLFGSALMGLFGASRRKSTAVAA